MSNTNPTAVDAAKALKEQFNEVVNANINVMADLAGTLGFFEKRPINLDDTERIETITRNVVRARPGISEKGYENIQLTLDKPFDGYHIVNDVPEATETNTMSFTRGGLSRQLFSIEPKLANIADDNGSMGAKDLAHFIRGAEVKFDLFYMPEGTVLRKGDEPSRKCIVKYVREIKFDKDIVGEIKLLNLSSALLSKVGASLVLSLIK